MNTTIKILGSLLDKIRDDLRRPHPFAFERVGFLRAGVAAVTGGLVIAIKDYRPVEDQDYEDAPAVGAQIGSDAIRKALQAAYRPQSTLLHVHTHGGCGYPAFSQIDLRSGEQFIPSFFNSIPKMPHGLIVLSNDAACGLLWYGSESRPVYVSNFIKVGAPYSLSWRSR